MSFKVFLLNLIWELKKLYSWDCCGDCDVYMIDMAGRQWVWGWSPTGRNGGDIYILRLRWIPRSIGGRMMCSPSGVWGHSLIKEGDGFLLMWLWLPDASEWLWFMWYDRMWYMCFGVTWLIVIWLLNVFVIVLEVSCGLLLGRFSWFRRVLILLFDEYSSFRYWITCLEAYD